MSNDVTVSLKAVGASEVSAALKGVRQSIVDMDAANARKIPVVLEDPKATFPGVAPTTADLTMAINWTHTTFLEIGPQFGFGIEYLVDRNLLIGLKASFGPQFYSYSGAGTDFAFTTEVVVGYRM